MHALRLYLFVLANLGIVAGYLFLALRVVPRVTVHLRRTKVGGVLFFLTCAMTHLELAGHTVLEGGIDLDDMLSLHMLAIHLVQVVAVWLFVTGLYVEFVNWGPWASSQAPVTSAAAAADPDARPE